MNVYCYRLILIIFFCTIPTLLSGAGAVTGGIKAATGTVSAATKAAKATSMISKLTSVISQIGKVTLKAGKNIVGALKKIPSIIKRFNYIFDTAQAGAGITSTALAFKGEQAPPKKKREFDEMGCPKHAFDRTMQFIIGGNIVTYDSAQALCKIAKLEMPLIDRDALKQAGTHNSFMKIKPRDGQSLSLIAIDSQGNSVAIPHGQFDLADLEEFRFYPATNIILFKKAHQERMKSMALGEEATLIKVYCLIKNNSMLQGDPGCLQAQVSFEEQKDLPEQVATAQPIAPLPQFLENLTIESSKESSEKTIPASKSSATTILSSLSEQSLSKIAPRLNKFLENKNRASGQ